MLVLCVLRIVSMWLVSPFLWMVCGVATLRRNKTEISFARHDVGSRFGCEVWAMFTLLTSFRSQMKHSMCFQCWLTHISSAFNSIEIPSISSRIKVIEPNVESLRNRSDFIWIHLITLNVNFIDFDWAVSGIGAVTSPSIRSHVYAISSVVYTIHWNRITRIGWESLFSWRGGVH